MFKIIIQLPVNLYKLFTPNFPLPSELDIGVQREYRRVIYKVGKFGTFSTRELMLRPGTYTVVGARPGYRDIRKQIIVDGTRNAAAFVVRCEEPI